MLPRSSKRAARAHSAGLSLPQRTRSSADAIEIELIRSLYQGQLPSVIMALGFAICGTLLASQTDDKVILVSLIGGIAASIARIAIAARDAERAASEAFEIEVARTLERRFAWAYIAFAVMLGLFAARSLSLPMPGAHLLVVCLVMGYAAGVAAGAALRPRLAIVSLIAAVVPVIIGLISWAAPLHVATGLMTTAFLGGGIFSVRKRHRRALDDVGLRLSLAALARHDGLTQLPNRLALREWFEGSSRSMDTTCIAVHCLDLNDFKPVNDQFGHPVGDALLTAVANRLEGCLREGDIAARLGGDEFSIVQRGIAHDDEARLLAQRIVASIAKPFSIGEHRIRISTAVGYVLSRDPRHDLEQLISLADEALYTAKRNNLPVIAWEPAKRSRSAA
jgi:diguanylate cyclase (GGDEF)-like protein